MTEGMAVLVPYLKALHIVGLVLWCGGLFALPGMLAWHDPAIGQADYRRIRHASHYTYTLAITPAAVIAVIAGTWLVLIRGVFDPWFFLKLFFVALLVGIHGWVGHTIVAVAERAGTHRPPSPAWQNLALLAVVIAILVLVLGKPDLGRIELPDWLTAPQQRQLPFDVPSR